MKLSKKTATIFAFALGFVILATSAFADIILGSGYYNLKESTKTTMEKLTSQVDNFTLDANITLKVDNNVFEESTSSAKFDIVNNARESYDINLNKGKKREYYSYLDENQNIYKNFEEDSYEVIERRKYNKEGYKVLDNPFEEDQLKDAEKILDALVGNLGDTIQVEESAGKKIYVGNLSDAEIPSLVNAVSSFMFKYSVLDERSAKRMGVPYPKSNIYLTNVMGKAIENEDGIIESGIFTASMSARDSEGVEHIYSLELSMDIKDINTTLVKAPNLDGQKVTYVKEGYEFDDKYVGKYKNDIVEVKGNSFAKVGERFIEISSAEDGNIRGKYYEIYKEGYKPDTINSFDFYSNYDETRYSTMINYVDNKGQKRNGVIHKEGLQNINVSFNVTFEDHGGYSYEHIDGFDNTFVRILE